MAKVVPFDRFAEFRKSYDSYPSQDNEGYSPDRGGFKCGFFSACDVLQPKLAACRDALIEIARVNFAGPSTDERREWTWAKSELTLRQVFGEES